MKDNRISDYVRNYFNRLHEYLSTINPEVFDQIIEQMETTRKANSTIYIIGNGGSASIASHIANDMGVGIRHEGIKPLKILSLTDNVSAISALGNDKGYDSIFSEQLRPILHPLDLLIALSVSGNSPNIIKAVEFAKKMGVTIIGCTGFDGGELKKLCDISFHIENEKSNYGPVEDAFMVLNHLIYTYYRFERYRS